MLGLVSLDSMLADSETRSFSVTGLRPSKDLTSRMLSSDNSSREASATRVLLSFLKTVMYLGMEPSIVRNVLRSDHSLPCLTFPPRL